jgi:hypothetical protein
MAITRQEVLAFTKRVADAGFSFESYDAFEKELMAIDKRAGRGLNVGKIVRFQIADGYAIYVVTKINARTVEVEHVALGDAWREPFIESAGGKLSRKMAEQCVRREEALRDLFEGKR